ncbi:unnamed protein product [Pieris macdunnoughi]|uniref:Uncharacterized protein n=1 Tax=Pieris macdunnoughi TaxID=345717 RepID=A0A821RMD1_9NEOP|nr:unnamed protein product [Pieris macdunnoughi]
MLFNNLMEGEAIAANTIISSIKNLNTDGKDRGTIKALLKNFILPETDMAIKHKHSLSEKCVYTVPMKPPMSPSYQRKTVNEAKQAFLNSTLKQSKGHGQARQEPTLHYAQIAITTSDDTRSTGGGKDVNVKLNPKDKSNPIDIPASMKKRIEQQHRKVSFKIKNASTLHRRPPIVTTMTITSNKVSELTKKFNDLVNNSSSGIVKQSKLVKTFEDLQTAYSASNSSTPSSTLSSSPNIKIVVQRHRRGSRKRNSRKRCSSMDSIDKLVLSDNSNSKIRVIRSKSDGNRIPKSPKKRLKYPDSNGQSGSDSVDGSPSKIISKTESQKQSNVVKSAIKKFECEINAQSNQTNTLQRNRGVDVITNKEKPKVPEKKSSLVVTKNLVLKDGVPKIKTIKPVLVDLSTKQVVNITQSESFKKKEPIYDKKKFKTNYIHSEKLPLHVVEIIQEEGSGPSVATSNNDNVCESLTNKEEKLQLEDIENSITPNESFLWRRKSIQMYSDCDKPNSENSYGFVSIIMNDSSGSCTDEQPSTTLQKDESQPSDNSESQIIEINQSQNASDFESNLIEAYNREVLVGFTSKPPKDEVEDDYEILEPRDDNVVVVTVKSDRVSKINCPLPEIPKVEESPPVENIYQCLLEMRSHPEGDESSLHNYETCGSQLEERTRGDGDSDDGYEYCKSPVKPYCHASSSGIQIAENYNPYASNNKNYSITKSVSGASTVSYEKIGSDRIYERIPPRPPKSKESSPKNKRDSIISDYNETENIYDSIKHPDGVSLSHCYESIPNSPSMIKLNTVKKQLPSAVQKRLSFDNVSNISQSTVSSEQKTNSIYGQRSVLSYNGQEVLFQVPSSETSVSDRSDRSDDWVDISDEEKTEEKKIIIVQERSRRKGLAWSQKVRHQWQNSPKQSENKGAPTQAHTEGENVNASRPCAALANGRVVGAPRVKVIQKFLKHEIRFQKVVCVSKT